MKETFLSKTSQYIIDKYKDNTEKLCIVLPNRRASLFLRKHIAENLGKNIWAPKIFSIEDFIEAISDYRLSDNVSLLFHIYKIHQEIEGKDARDFDDFMSMGEILLHDFNEADLYLVDVEGMFSYLSEAKAISLWNLDGQALSEFQKKYLKFYNSLFSYYAKLKEVLASQNIAYQGMMYREVATNIEYKANSNEWDNIIFAGFNALTQSEEEIINYLLKENKAEILWDADKYYVSNPMQEAGRFIRKYMQTWLKPDFNWLDDNFATDTKEINVVGIAQKIGQVKYAGSILKELYQKNGNLDNTAIVLSDESLLLPMLHSIPPELEEFNVTMGLSFKNTTLFSLFDSILYLHENRIRLVHSSTAKGFYYKDILKVLSHPYIKKILDVDELISRISNSNKISYKAEELFSKSGGDLFSDNKLSFIFDVYEKPEGLINCLHKLIDILKLHLKESNADMLEKEYLYHFAKLLYNLNSIPELHQSFIKIETFRRIFTKLAAIATIPFYGEPLKGLQVMGMLETRTLDFDNVILLSVNEGILPSSSLANSFIPLDIKKEFGLPIYQDKDAVFGYHFYRLLQRASTAYIIYNTESDDFSGGDKSRFIYQLTHELSAFNPNIKINETLMNVRISSEIDTIPIIIDKDETINSILLNRATKGFSASALNTYINCSLQFYLKYIANIQEPEEVEGVIEANTLGSVIHAVLNELFLPNINQVLTLEMIDLMLPKVEKLVIDKFKDIYVDGDISFGVNLLTSQMAAVYVNNYLSFEKTEILKYKKEGRLITVKSLEEKYETIVDIKVDNKIQPVKLLGFIDRVDFTGSTINITDYKTGKTDKNELKVEAPLDIISESKYAKSFQLLMYAFLYSRENPDNNFPIETGIVSFRSLANGFMKLSVSGEDVITKNTLNMFEDLLKQLLSDIFNPSLSFTQTDITDNCKYCIYKEICGR